MKSSIIIPAYNAEKALGFCLQSVQTQVFSDFETVIVDNSSPNRYGTIPRTYRPGKA